MSTWDICGIEPLSQLPHSVATRDLQKQTSLLLGKLLTQMVKKFLAFMESEALLASSQSSAIRSIPIQFHLAQTSNLLRIIEEMCF
jgi:hypothetical protein